MTPIEAIVAACFPTESVRSTTEPSQGNEKRTSIVTLSSGRQVVIQQSRSERSLETQFVLTREIIARTDVPVAAPIAAGALDGTPYLISEHVAGTDLHTQFTQYDQTDQREIAYAFGRVLGTLHDAFQFSRCGDVFATNGSLAVQPSTGDSWLRSYALAGIDALPDAFDRYREPLTNTINEANSSENLDARLYPWDLRPGNALVRDGELTAIVDWSQPKAAPPGLSVAKVSHLVAAWYGESPAQLHAALRSGYRSIRSLPSVSTVEQIAALTHSAVDSNGIITRPGYPEQRGMAAADFHRTHFDRILES